MRTMIRSVTSVGLAVALSFAVAAPAHAQTCEGRPGSAAVDQYCEAIPGASGNEGPSSGAGSKGGKGSSGTTSAVDAGTGAALKAAGADGQALLTLAERGGSSGGGGSDGAAPAKAPSTGGERPSGRVVEAPQGSPLRAVASSVDNGATAGRALLWGLVGATVLAAAVAIFRARAR